MKNKIIRPTILPGFMELLPSEQIQFNQIMEVIKNTFEESGFVPMDTPIIEKTEVLLAKGGKETDKQIYSFIRGSNNMSLRFDLTVPFARYSAQYFSELTFPFRRYQIGKVFRGERNQKGRYREFYQCDIDIISNRELSIINDAELPSIMYSVFNKIGLKHFTIRINSRKVLNGFLDSIGITDYSSVLRVIDKIDKVGMGAVKEELSILCIEESRINKIMEFMNIKGNSIDVIDNLKGLGIVNSSFLDGLRELEQTTLFLRSFGVPEENFAIDLKIARGLDYYTGIVYETILNDYQELGSICSGGRYDNLAQYYTEQKLQGVGMSIGLTRLFYILKEKGLLKQNRIASLSKVLVIPIDNTIEYASKIAGKLRREGINTQIYFENEKLGRKLNYANKLGINYVIIIGEREVEDGLINIKNMSTGEQRELNLKEAIELIKSNF